MAGQDVRGAYRLLVWAGGMAGPGSGAWTRLSGLVAALARRGDVTVCVAVDDPAAAEALRHDAPGADVELVPRLTGIRRLTGAGRRIRRSIARSRVDLVSLEVSPVPRGLAVPATLTVHDLRALHGLGLRRLPSTEDLNTRLLLGRSARRAAAVVAVSPWTAADVRARLGVPADRVHVVPNPIAIASSVPTGGPAPGLEDGRPYVLAVGHLERRKNLSVLAEAVLDPAWPEDLLLVLAGRDHGMGDALRDALGPRGRVLGPLPDAELARLRSGALAVLVPSLLEGFGYSAVEAVAAGVPALVADRAALPDTVGVTAACVAADDPSAWARAVRGLATDPAGRAELLLAERAALERFDPDAVAERLVDLHRRLLVEHGR